MNLRNLASRAVQAVTAEITLHHIRKENARLMGFATVAEAIDHGATDEDLNFDVFAIRTKFAATEQARKDLRSFQ